MGIETVQAPPGRAARVTGLALQSLTAVGAVAGVKGFLDGTFDPLVDQLHDAWPLVDGRVLPALALAATVGVPQVGALVLGLRRHPRAPDAALAVGAVLTGWVTFQLPLIGWTSPVQWAFAAIGLAEVAAGLAWRRADRRRRARGGARHAVPAA
ncbi:hypothetical protein [Actinotalea solisilvae]|uniref:hypothetical protein n=1 Tax=Actinotalea solisilvae TaxID=2072922 RepID=UPI0018F26403|nr:hypothetical protein [Actinotalea solisilvae]